MGHLPCDVRDIDLDHYGGVDVMALVIEVCSESEPQILKCCR
jgi:hypothetical protein